MRERADLPDADERDPWDDDWRTRPIPEPATQTRPAPVRTPAKIAAAFREAAGLPNPFLAEVDEARERMASEGGPVVDPATSEEGTATPGFYWWADLRADPALLTPPKMVLPRLAWEGRATLLAAPEKLGKSTITTQALVAGLQYGEFLGETAHVPAGLWLALDEPLGDLVRRVESFAASDLPLAVMDFPPDVGALAAVLDAVHPTVVVVDCLSAFAAGRVERFKDPEQWRQLLGGAVLPLFRQHGAASIWLHHSVRDGTRYADSREIGALMDTIVEMEPVPGAPTQRTVKGKGRGYPADWSRYTLDYHAGRYELVDGPVALETRILRAIQADPGIGKRRLRDQVQGRNDEIDEAVAGLIRAGMVRDQGTPTSRRYYAAPAGVPQGAIS